jgi:hypothetical protein
MIPSGRRSRHSTFNRNRDYTRRNIMVPLPVQQQGRFAVRYIRLAKALLLNERLSRQRLLGELLVGACEGVRGPIRAVFLREVSAQLCGRIVPVERAALEVGTGSLWQRGRRHAQRLGLSMLDEGTIRLVCRRDVARRFLRGGARRASYRLASG